MPSPIASARRCPRCGRKAKVKDVRDEGQVTRRVRRCETCLVEYTTIEKRAERAQGWVDPPE